MRNFNSREVFGVRKAMSMLIDNSFSLLYACKLCNPMYIFSLIFLENNGRQWKAANGVFVLKMLLVTFCRQRRGLFLWFGSSGDEKMRKQCLFFRVYQWQL
jgi:hypothetical protein